MRRRPILAIAFAATILLASSSLGVVISKPAIIESRGSPNLTTFSVFVLANGNESDESKLAFEGLKKALMDGLDKLGDKLRDSKEIPEDLVKALDDLADKLKDVKGWSDLLKWLEDWADFFRKYGRTFEAFAKKVIKLLPIVSLLLDVPEIIQRIKNASTQLEGFMDYLILICEILRGLGIIIGDVIPIPLLLDLLQFLADYIGEKLSDLIFKVDWSKVWEFFKELGVSLLDFLESLWEMFKALGVDVWEFIKWVWDLMQQLGMSIWEFIEWAWEKVKALGVDIWEFLKWVWGLMQQLGIGIWEFIDWAWEKVKDMGIGFWDFLGRMWDLVFVLAPTQLASTQATIAIDSVQPGDAAVAYLSVQNVGAVPGAVSAGSLQIVSTDIVLETLSFSMSDVDHDGLLDIGGSAYWTAAFVVPDAAHDGPLEVEVLFRYNAETEFLTYSLDLTVDSSMKGQDLAAYLAYIDAVRWIRAAYRNGDIDVTPALEILAGGTPDAYKEAKKMVVNTHPGPGHYEDLR